MESQKREGTRRSAILHSCTLIVPRLHSNTDWWLWIAYVLHICGMFDRDRTFSGHMYLQGRRLGVPYCISSGAEANVCQ